MQPTKLKRNQVKIGEKVYVKDVTAILYNGEYYPRKDIGYDTYRKENNLVCNLYPYIDVISGEKKYTSFLVNVFLKNKFSKVCKSFIDENPEFIEHPELTKNASSDYYISKFDNSISTFDKYTPESKVYNLSRYNGPIAKLKNSFNKLSWIDYTFGFELETSAGRINSYYANKHGFANLYDGSINGVEYVSTVMNSSNLHYLYEFITGAKVTTIADRFCSFHIHIGNVPKTERNLLSMYILFQRLTDELNQLIVPYKKDLNFLSEKLRVNGRDHCKNLPKLISKDVFEIYKLFKIDSYSDDFDSENDDNQLTNYINNTNKWNINGRYYTVNFMNYICKDTSSNTVEIRSLQSTYNFDYIITWLLINTAVIDYAIRNAEKVINSKEKIELIDCIEHYVKDPSILNPLIANIKSIKNYFYNQYYHRSNSLTDIQIVDANLSKILIPYNIFDYTDIDIKDSIYYKFHQDDSYNRDKERFIRELRDMRFRSSTVEATPENTSFLIDRRTGSIITSIQNSDNDEIEEEEYDEQYDEDLDD